MNQKPSGRASSSEQIIRDIKRNTRKQYSAEEKIRIVLDGLRGGHGVGRAVSDGAADVVGNSGDLTTAISDAVNEKFSKCEEHQEGGCN